MPFGIKDHKTKIFIELKNLTLTGKKLKYFDESESKTKYVSRFIKENKGLKTTRWINHLVFKNGFGKIVDFKKYLKSKGINLKS